MLRLLDFPLADRFGEAALALAARTRARTNSSLRIERHAVTPNLAASLPRSLTVCALREAAVYNALDLRLSDLASRDARTTNSGLSVVHDNGPERSKPTRQSVAE